MNKSVEIGAISAVSHAREVFSMTRCRATGRRLRFTDARACADQVASTSRPRAARGGVSATELYLKLYGSTSCGNRPRHPAIRRPTRNARDFEL